jgi:hypothetical protein
MNVIFRHERNRNAGTLLNRLAENSFLPEKYANFPMNLRVNFQTHGFFSILLTTTYSLTAGRRELIE